MLTFALSRLQPYYRLSALAKTICYSAFAAVIAMSAASAQVASGTTGIDASGNASNALRRCEVFKAAEDQSACRARVMGETEAQGSVAGGGVLRETETVVPAAP